MVQQYSWRGVRGRGDETVEHAYTADGPFFLGLITVQFMIAGICPIVDYLSGMTDNVVFWI